eukprot:1710441-Rhodomonas_salina.3
MPVVGRHSSIRSSSTARCIAAYAMPAPDMAWQLGSSEEQEEADGRLRGSDRGESLGRHRWPRTPHRLQAPIHLMSQPHASVGPVSP